MNSWFPCCIATLPVSLTWHPKVFLCWWATRFRKLERETMFQEEMIGTCHGIYGTRISVKYLAILFDEMMGQLHHVPVWDHPKYLVGLVNHWNRPEIVSREKFRRFLECAVRT
jgi:hypothetical protein